MLRRAERGMVGSEGSAWPGTARWEDVLVWCEAWVGFWWEEDEEGV
jgi:hypothetical protein